jgi:hypothetical protein
VSDCGCSPAARRRTSLRTIVNVSAPKLGRVVAGVKLK